MSNIRTAVITGITGQDGAYLSQLLLSKNYKVIGIIRRSSVDTTIRLKTLGVLSNPNFILAEGDVTDIYSLQSIISKYQPDEVYNLAAQSHVHTSFEQPAYTWAVNAQGCLNLLEAIRSFSPHSRFYQASTSEMFGVNCGELVNVASSEHPIYSQDENTKFEPTSPYAVAKLAAHQTVQMYRRAYSLHASSGILHNHESKLRGENFVTRKITKWLANVYIKYGGKPSLLNDDHIHLGNIKACRDWGHAKDFVYGMWLMLQQDEPDDYVLATGETHEVLDFVCEAFDAVGWSNDPDYVTQFIYIDPEFYRPSDVPYLLGNPNKAKEKLGWEPKIGFKELVSEMVWYDIEEAKNGIYSS